MNSFDEYGKRYPELVYDLYMFYTNSEIKSMMEKQLKGINPDLGYKCPIDFCTHYKHKYTDLGGGGIIQPNIVKKICDILFENGFLNKYIPALLNNYNDWIAFYGANKIINSIPKELLVNMLNNITYGFKYIYHASKEHVLPVFVKKGEKSYIGTCFKTIYGIITAKHCIEHFDNTTYRKEPFDAIQIGSLNSDLLNNAEIITQGDMDFVIIKPKGYIWSDCFLIEKGEILDDIMAMGFPQHGGFDNFVTATIGSIAAIENSYLCKHDLMLLTTKLNGGNSGGPVLNKNGRVVGVITDAPMSKGEQYDQFGYGMAIPLHNVSEIIENGEKYGGKVNFVNDINEIA